MRYFSRTTNGNNGVPAHCDYELAKELAVFPDESNRPEIFSHHFRGEVADVSPRAHVIIFHKVTGNDAAWLRHFSGIIRSAQDLHDQGAEEQAMIKLYDLYKHDSALVNKTFPRTVLYTVLKGYRLKLIAGNRSREAEQLGKTLSSLAASLPAGSHRRFARAPSSFQSPPKALPAAPMSFLCCLHRMPQHLFRAPDFAMFPAARNTGVEQFARHDRRGLGWQDENDAVEFRPLRFMDGHGIGCLVGRQAKERDRSGSAAASGKKPSVNCGRRDPA